MKASLQAWFATSHTLSLTYKPVKLRILCLMSLKHLGAGVCFSCPSPPKKNKNKKHNMPATVCNSTGYVGNLQ